MKYISIKILSAIILTTFIFLLSNAQAFRGGIGGSDDKCDIKEVRFTPSTDEINTNIWFKRDKRPTFTIKLVNNGECAGKPMILSLANVIGANNDIEALNDQPFNFNQGANEATFKFLAGEEACDAYIGRNDCQLELYVKLPNGSSFWSKSKSGRKGELSYECDSKVFCDETNYPFKLLDVQGGKTGGTASPNLICAYKAGDGKFACINNSGSRATQDKCKELKECEGRNCVPINSEQCVAGDKGEKPPPGKELDTKFQLTPPAGFPRTLEELFDYIGGFIFAISIPIAVILIIFSGLMMLTSAGNVARVNKAKTILWYTILGLAIIFIGKGFITLIQSILGG